MIRKKLPFQKIINILAGKRFSRLEMVFLALITLILMFLAQKWMTSYIAEIKNQSGIIVNTTPPSGSQVAAVDLTQGSTSAQTQNAVVVSQKPKTEMRDPFLPSMDTFIKIPTEEKKPIADLKISGILWDQNVPTAIINSTVVKIGDIVAGKTIVDMEKNRIILMENGEMFVLELRQKSQ